ncbi:unnamed protein product [Orchesella dallaii]|uniref:RNA-directed DNA polymerase n=1 Tax=Orchesella dallaii TaxID=48710 RepID=A0ABP1RQH3_9HEXA
MPKLPVPVFIGADFMKKFDIVLQLKLGKFWFGNDPDQCYPIEAKAENQGTLHFSIPNKSKVYSDDEAQEKVKKILRRYKTVARTDGTVGITNATYHVIEAEGPPVKSHVYRYSPIRRKIINQQVEAMLESGLCRPSTSPYAAPVVVATKKNGEARICFDYKKLNAQTKDNSSSMESAHSMLRTIPHGMIYSCLDLASGYWQVMLSEESIEKSAFVTQDGHYEMLVMPFGIKNAPKTFQNLMRKVLRGYLDDFCKVYLDDIIIWSRTMEEHLHHIELVMERLKAANLTINEKKCSFAKREVEYLGHIIGPDGIRKKPETTRAIRKFPIPANRRDLQSFLGLCNWYHAFIENFMELAEPLYKLTKKEIPFIWTEDQQQAFEKIKKKICEDVILASINYECPIIMKTDASSVGLGAVLCNTIDGVDRPIAFASKLLKKAERHYHIYEKEAFALIFGHRKFREFLEGQKFTIQIDNRALNYIRLMKEKKPKIQRWAQEISQWNADIILKPGKDNVEADVLSRHPVRALKTDPMITDDGEEHSYAPIAAMFEDTITKETLLEEQEKDTFCEPLRRLLKTSEAKKVEATGFKLIEDILMKRVKHKLMVDEPEAEVHGWLNTVVGDDFDWRHTKQFIDHYESSENEEVDQSCMRGTDKAVNREAGSSRSQLTQSHLSAEGTTVKETSGREAFPNQTASRSTEESKKIISKTTMSNSREKKDKEEKTNRRRRKDEITPPSTIAKTREITQARKVKEYYVPVIPKALQNVILRMFHDEPEAGHFGFKTTLRRLRIRCFWEGMQQEIREYCQSCEICQASKASRQLPFGLLQPIEPPSAVFERIFIDYLGPLPRSSKQNCYCLIVVDNLSKWVEVFPVRQAVATKTAELLENEIFLRYGVPRAIVSDNASQFASKTMATMCRKYGVEHRFTAPYHPNPNQAERTIQTIKQMFQAYTSEKHSEWDKDLKKFAFAINTAVNETTQVTPALLNLGREIPVGFDRAIQKITKFEHQESIDELKKLPEKLAAVIKAVRDNIKNAQEGHEKQQNKKRRDHKFQPGDLVMIKTHEQSNKAAKVIQKMIQRYRGPYKLGEQVNEVTFEILTVPKDECLGIRHVEELLKFRKRKGCEIVSPECKIVGKKKTVRRKKPRSS